MLSGMKWGVSPLTFSFPTSASCYEYGGERDSNFKAFNPDDVGDRRAAGEPTCSSG